MIFPPTDHADPAAWAAVFAGHVSVGLVLCAVLAATVGRFFGQPTTAGAQIAIVGYALIWELGVQRLGAGLADAAVDTFAVGLGAFIAGAAWRNRGRAVAVAMAVGLAAIWRGIVRRL